MPHRRWCWVFAAATALALLSLISNLTTAAQLSGQADFALAVRFTISKLVNSGTIWAGLGILSGWLVRRAPQAFVAGIAACTFALLTHYGLGRFFGVFTTDVWASNSYWFLAALVAGGPLGLIGAVARQASLLGLAARLVVPVAAILEPFVVGMFGQPTILPWPDRVSSVVTGSILLATGVAGLTWSLFRRGGSTQERWAPPSPKKTAETSMGE